MKNKKDFNKFTKRSKNKKHSKEAARRELMRAVAECGVRADALKIKGSVDGAHHESRLSVGIYRGSKSSYGFVTVEGVSEDIFIPAGNSRGAIDGDLVEIKYHEYEGRGGETKTEGRVTKIIELGRRTVIGTLCEELLRHGRRTFRAFYVQPDDPKIAITPYVSDLGGARLYDKVEALIRRDGTSNPPCDVIRVFGKGDSREANYEAILAECDIITEFTDDELYSAERLAAEPVLTEGREDLTGEVILTIDGESAKDLDDAISLRRLAGGGYSLGVHIADVSHYVREKTPLDRCVMQRGTSVYFTDKVVPMLPPALSNGACSLNAGENKYALSAIIKLDADGSIIDLKLKESVIKSRVRGVYSEVNQLFSGDANAEIKRKYKAVLPTLDKMRELYEILLNKSQSRGAIDFDADEVVIVLSENGSPISIEKRERGIAERMIEQFMLTANEAVATYLSKGCIPCVYRIHEAPPEDNFNGFLDYIECLGFDTRILKKGEPTPKLLSDLLKKAEEKGKFNSVSYAMLRSMAKAKYSEHNTGHFGLGIKNYCHFTSPIRRLSDLATHRIIKKVLFESKRPEAYASYAKRAAAAATEGELRAISAERRIEDLYKVVYMSDHIGEIFDAEVSSITQFGMFCMLGNTCEGLVPISEMPGVFTFDERSLTMRSRYETYHIADRLSVKLEEANVTRGKLRFSIAKELN